MPGPRETELGIRSPLKLRAGIDFTEWNGINLQNDPGAIRDVQFQSLINARINGNDIVNRGGQTKTYNTGVDGCIYSMIDVQGDLGIFVFDTFGNSSTLFGFPSINRLGLASNLYSQSVDGNGNTPFDFSALPRRDIIPFQGKLYTFGADAVTLVTGLYSLSFPSGDDSGSTSEPAKWTLAVALADFNTFVVRQELTNSGGNQALYIGTKSSNTIYKWDGVTLTTEATGVGSGPLVMGLYRGEIYAASTNSFLARGVNATWTTSYAMPGGVTSFTPSSMTEYVNVGLICGNDTTVGQRSKVLAFDGTSLTVSYNPANSKQFFTDIATGSNGLAYYAWSEDNTTTRLSTFNGSVWTNVFNTVNDSNAITGALLPLGSDLYWWTSNDCSNKNIGTNTDQTGVVLIRFPGYSIADAEVILEGVNQSGPGANCPIDMNILA